MGHFLHRPECRSWVYAWACPECASRIFVYQCTCGSGLFLDDNRPPWPRHDCDAAMVRASLAGVGGWLKNGREASTGKGRPFESLKGFVAVGQGDQRLVDSAGNRSPAPPVLSSLPTKAMDPMPGEVESFICVVRELQASTDRLKTLYAGLGDLGRKLLDLPALSAVCQVTLEKNDLDPVETYTAVLPKALAAGVGVSRIVWVELHAAHGADRSAWVVTSLTPLD